MADVKWIKLTTNMFEDEKIDFITSLPESDAILVIWVRLLTLAGKCNAGGYIYLTEMIPYTEEMLCHKFRKSPSIVKLSLETFKRLGMVDFDERGIFLPNWDKHQNVEGMEKIKKQTAERVARHRKKQKLLSNAEDVTQECNVTVTQGNATELDIELDKDIDNIIINAREANVSDSLENANESEEDVTEKAHIANDLDEPASKAEENRPKDIGTRAVDWAQEKWGRPISPGEAECIVAWCDEFANRGSQEPDAVVIEALRQCDETGPTARNKRYLNAVLKDWQASGVLTVAHVKAREAERKSQKEHKRNKGPGPGDKPPRTPKPPSGKGKYDDFYL